MNLSFTLRRSHLQVFSAISSNFSVVFLLAMFATSDLLALTGNIVLAIVSIILAVVAEELLEYYD